MIHSKNKGNRFELQILKELELLTGEKLFTARNSNRMIDGEGVDIETSEYYVQCKSVERSINTHKIIQDMKVGKDKLLFHKRNRQGTIVSMDMDTFKKLLRGNELLGC